MRHTIVARKNVGRYSLWRMETDSVRIIQIGNAGISTMSVCLMSIRDGRRTNYGDYFAELQMYQTGPMNYVVVAVYRDVPGVREELSKILHYVNEEYRVTVGQNVRRKQILKFDRAKKLYGPKTNGTIDTM